MLPDALTGNQPAILLLQYRFAVVRPDRINLLSQQERGHTNQTREIQPRESDDGCIGVRGGQADLAIAMQRANPEFMTLEARRAGESTFPEPPRVVGSDGVGAGLQGTNVGADVAGSEKLRAAAPWTSLQQERQLVRARHTVYRAGDVLAGIPIVHAGWAARVRRLPDGRRQILSFILPGELISAGAVFADRLSFFVEAITDVRYAVYRRTEASAILAQDPELLRVLISGCLAEKAELEVIEGYLPKQLSDEELEALVAEADHVIDALAPLIERGPSALPVAAPAGQGAFWDETDLDAPDPPPTDDAEP